MNVTKLRIDLSSTSMLTDESVIHSIMLQHASYTDVSLRLTAAIRDRYIKKVSSKHRMVSVHRRMAKGWGRVSFLITPVNYSSFFGEVDIRVGTKPFDASEPWELNEKEDPQIGATRSIYLLQVVRTKKIRLCLWKSPQFNSLHCRSKLFIIQVADFQLRILTSEEEK